jgi:CBS domain containing-hemolysin-like protein
MVVVLTYFSLILGELVPKRLALTHPEAIASIIAGRYTRERRRPRAIGR